MKHIAQIAAPATQALERRSAPVNAGANAGPEAGGLLEYWRVIRRRKGTLILIALLGAIAGLLVSLPQTPVYQARTSLEIQDINDNFITSSR